MEVTLSHTTKVILRRSPHCQDLVSSFIVSTVSTISNPPVWFRQTSLTLWGPCAKTILQIARANGHDILRTALGSRVQQVVRNHHEIIRRRRVIREGSARKTLLSSKDFGRKLSEPHRFMEDMKGYTLEGESQRIFLLYIMTYHLNHLLSIYIYTYIGSSSCEDCTAAKPRIESHPPRPPPNALVEH